MPDSCPRQNKQAEIAFFDQYSGGGYDVFDAESKNRIVGECLRILATAKELRPGMLFADFGCGSGVFTGMLAQHGFQTIGIDLSHKLLAAGKAQRPSLAMVAGDVELLPLASASLDLILFSGILHHLPDQARCAAEAFRVLKPGGAFVAFDPNRLNPFMWIYRDKSSPLHSTKGVSVNETPINPGKVAKIFVANGFSVKIDYLSGLHYRMIASSFMRPLLPVYNWLDEVIFTMKLLRRHRAFVITVGTKP